MIDGFASCVVFKILLIVHNVLVNNEISIEPINAVLVRPYSVDASQIIMLTRGQRKCFSTMVVNEKFILFQLFNVLDIEKNLLNDTPRFRDTTKIDIIESLATARKISEDQFAPHNRKNDTQEPHWKAGQDVVINKEVSVALKAFNEAGFNAAHSDYDLGGMQLPSVVTNALMMPLYSGNIGTMTFPFLTIAAGNMLRAAGNKEQIQKYLVPMLEGKFTGTMNLSEPQAGSSLGDITTRAYRRDDGTYSINGTKMWISGGEHSLSDNIVHMVLAKVCDPVTKAIPPGVKGISLFIVPKRRLNTDGTLGELNDVALAGLNHKMGWRGATNCVLNYGENGNCVGELLGQEGKGLATMFLMMNEARIGVGVIAASLGYAGYAQSLTYAKERRQGRANKDPLSEQVAIIRHSDVKRMLLVQKVYVEGSISLCLYGSMLVDQSHSGSNKETKLLLDTLTPIIKSWPSEWCLEANKWAIQIHGGYGFTRDYSVEQHYRDNRLNMIHEGTNGIQSIDLLGRKVHAANGEGFRILLSTMRASLVDADIRSKPHSEALERAIACLEETTQVLAKIESAELMLCNSHEYLNMAGHVVIAWRWFEMENAAYKLLESSEDTDFCMGQIMSSRFFFEHELPKIFAQAQLLQSKNDTNLVMKESWF